ncbi:MAG: hypothetical protein ACTHYC_10050 [Sphingobacterium sp.]
MKKLKRISLEILEEDLGRLTNFEKEKLFGGTGGTGGIDGYCYFYTLEYLGEQYGGYAGPTNGHPSTDLNTYMDVFASQYDYSPGYMASMSVEGGVSHNEYVEFTTLMFNSQYMHSEGQMQSNLMNGVEVAGNIMTGENVAHSVVFKSYDSETNTYQYVDPMNESAGLQSASMDSFMASSFLAVGSSGTVFY